MIGGCGYGKISKVWIEQEELRYSIIEGRPSSHENILTPCFNNSLALREEVIVARLRI
jgi:hypothetical protein